MQDHDELDVEEFHALETAIKNIEQMLEHDDISWVISLLNAYEIMREQIVSAMTLAPINCPKYNLLDASARIDMLIKLSKHKEVNERLAMVLAKLFVQAEEIGVEDEGLADRLDMVIQDHHEHLSNQLQMYHNKG